MLSRADSCSAQKTVSGLEVKEIQNEKISPHAIFPPTDSASHSSVEKAISDPQVETSQEEGGARYSLFTKTEKWCIVGMVSYAALCSNIGSFIYYPALDLLSKTFSVSVSQINLTVTSYMAVATVAPTLVGDFADVLGRRPAFLVTLSLFVTADICLALAKSYEQLLGFRVLQALGVSGVIPIAYGVISDVASPAERGSFVSAVSFSTTIAPSLGPILGGVLSYSPGWTWIFWFLTILSGLCLLFILFFLPESSRNIVGNGSIAPAPYLRLPISRLKFMQPWKDSNTNFSNPTARKRRIPNPLHSLKILLRKDNAIVVLANGLMYTVYACNIATLSTLCIEIYELNEWQAGLIYLPFGLGGTVSTFLSGWLLDNTYRNSRTRMGLSTDKVRGDDLDDFPIEKARLRVMWFPMVVIGVCVVGYGWVLDRKEHLALPLALQFIIGLALQINFSAFQTLIVDINHRSPSAAGASTALVRCGLAAIAVAFLEDMIQAIGIGWTFTFLGALCGAVLGLFGVEYVKGMEWRREALARESGR